MISACLLANDDAEDEDGWWNSLSSHTWVPLSIHPSFSFDMARQGRQALEPLNNGLNDDDDDALPRITNKLISGRANREEEEKK